jgi:hypothetical protein
MTSTAAYSEDTYTVAYANYSAVTSGGLLARCQSDNVTYREFCYGYVLGVAGGATTAACMPDRVTVGQLAKVVERSLEVKAQSRDWDARPLVTLAITNAWPCK